MKQKIDPKDIRKGDLIREESRGTEKTIQAVEYVANFDMHTVITDADSYLLERPEPPFEPYWGMVIQHPRDKNCKAVYTPDIQEAKLGEGEPWAFTENGENLDEYQGNRWAKQKLADGWVVVGEPENVK